MCWYNDNSDVNDFDADDSDNVKNIFYVLLKGLRYNQSSNTFSSVILNAFNEFLMKIAVDPPVMLVIMLRSNKIFFLSFIK